MPVVVWPEEGAMLWWRSHRYGGCGWTWMKTRGFWDYTEIKWEAVKLRQDRGDVERRRFWWLWRDEVKGKRELQNQDKRRQGHGDAVGFGRVGGDWCCREGNVLSGWVTDARLEWEWTVRGETQTEPVRRGKQRSQRELSERVSKRVDLEPVNKRRRTRTLFDEGSRWGRRG